MSIAKVGLDGLNVPAKIQYVRRLAAAITGNPNFTTPTPTVAALTAGGDSLETLFNEAKAARLASKSKTGLLDDQSAAVDLLVNQLASYVDTISNGDAAIIESAGFAIRATPAPIGQLPAPVDLRVTAGEHPGSADLRWEFVDGSRAYLVERATDAPILTWEIIASSTKAEGSYNSMVSGTKYWHRVAAIGTAGQSPWSDPVALIAP